MNQKRAICQKRKECKKPKNCKTKLERKGKKRTRGWQRNKKRIGLEPQKNCKWQKGRWMNKKNKEILIYKKEKNKSLKMQRGK